MINAFGTVVILEALRKFSKNSIFILCSTNKVYGERPNEFKLIEKDTRYDYMEIDGIDETLSVDNTMHTPMGASKLSADIYTQEYHKTYGIKTATFRLGCITGTSAKSVEMHNWLPFFFKKNLSGEMLSIFGFKGKQVRDLIDARDLVEAFYLFFKNPKPGEIYNLGGGRINSISLIEAIHKIEKLTGKKSNYILQEKRLADHQVYVTDFSKFRNNYPEWNIKINLDIIFNDLYNSLKHNF